MYNEQLCLKLITRRVINLAIIVKIPKTKATIIGPALKSYVQCVAVNIPTLFSMCWLIYQ